jgi:hypothetical protein
VVNNFRYFQHQFLGNETYFFVLRFIFFVFPIVFYPPKVENF